MTKPLSAFHDLLLPELPGCLPAMVNLQLLQAAREFCAASSAWLLPYDPVDLLASQATYDLEPSETQSEVVRVVRLTIGDQLLWANTDRERDGEDCPKYSRNDPPFSLSPDLVEITLLAPEVPTADLAGGLQVVGAMKPKATATVLPDFLLSQYSDAMRYGTLARLMRMAKKPWTDQALAADYQTRWHMASNFAAVQAQVGNTRAGLRVKKW